MRAGRCGAITAHGKRCRNWREAGHDLCEYHAGLWSLDEATRELIIALREHIRAVTQIARELEER